VQNDWTPLHFAACNGRLEVAHVLLECGADREAKEKVRVPLQCPAVAGAVRSLILLR
jgi:hypothetical protein